MYCMRWSYLRIKQIQISEDWSEIRDSWYRPFFITSKVLSNKISNFFKPIFAFHIPLARNIVVSIDQFSHLFSEYTGGGQKKVAIIENMVNVV